MNRKQRYADHDGPRPFTILAFCAFLLLAAASMGAAQQPASAETEVQDRIRTLTTEMSRVEAQLQESQRQLADLKQALASLRSSTGSPESSSTETTPPAGAADLATAVAEIRETQAMQETQIATLDQSKVESASKYPVRLTGMILLNGFVDTHRVDAAATPSVALYGSGSTGASVRQTIFGLDVAGPQVFGARTSGDLRLDMNASASGSGYSGSYALGLVRLRTAHLDLDWSHSRAFFALDRPLLSPEVPSSLTAVAVPALAWSGNLWAWNPQVGASVHTRLSRELNLRIDSAMMDVADPPPLYPSTPNGAYTPPSTAELSRWPGVESRIGLETEDPEKGFRIGASGYYAPHRTSDDQFRFDAWVGAADFGLPISRFTRLSTNAYWGSALGGLGGGAYKDIVARVEGGELYYQALDDRGGWVQWKQLAGPKLEFNEAFGVDEVPAGQLRPFAIATPVSEYNLARNRTFTGNVIYSPSAYLLFSLEYRRILSSYVTAPGKSADVIGIAAGYKF